MDDEHLCSRDFTRIRKALEQFGVVVGNEDTASYVMLSRWLVTKVLEKNDG